MVYHKITSMYLKPNLNEINLTPENEFLIFIVKVKSVSNIILEKSTELSHIGIDFLIVAD